MDKGYLPKNKYLTRQASLKITSLMKKKKINYLESIPKGKELVVLAKMGLRKEGLLYSTMVNSMSLGSGMKGKISSKKL